MKDSLVFLFFLIFVFNVSAQKNINPDPNGDPWIVGGAPTNYDCYDVGENFIPTPTSLQTMLPSSVYNNEHVPNYLPPVYGQ